MDASVLTAVLVVAVLALLALVGFGVRRRRARAIEPVQLGPRWTPPGTTAEPADRRAEDERVDILAGRTGVEPTTVSEVLMGWDEHLAVLGLVELPPGHRYRVYDPYDPPVAERRDGRPVPDPQRVARDVARRGQVDELDARLVLDALLGDDEAPTSEPPDDGGAATA